MKQLHCYSTLYLAWKATLEFGNGLHCHEADVKIGAEVILGPDNHTCYVIDIENDPGSIFQSLKLVTMMQL